MSIGIPARADGSEGPSAELMELTEDLHFDVSGLLNELLNKQRAVAERRQGLRVRPLVVLLKFLQDKHEDSGH